MSAASPILDNDLVIVNASVESESLVALNQKTGQEVWRVGGIPFVDRSKAGRRATEGLLHVHVLLVSGRPMGPLEEVILDGKDRLLRTGLLPNR